MWKLALLAVLLTWGCQTDSNQQTASTSQQAMKDSLTADMQSIHERGFINGFGVAIVTENGSIYSEGFGYADIKNNQSYTKNTIQNIGSVSKTFIGVALLKAQELNKLKLDDPINQYLPFEIHNPIFPDTEITLRHLATHTSTIRDTDDYNQKSYVLKDSAGPSEVAGISERFNPVEDHISLMDFMEKLLSDQGEWYRQEQFLESKPGEIYEYSNIGAALAAAVIEMATNTSFNAFATEHILKPLNMTSSGWSFQDIDLQDHSVLYADPETELPRYSLITYPDGGLITSPADLAKYLTELIRGYSGNGSLLNGDSYQELFRIQLEDHQFLERDVEDDYDDEYNTGIFMGYSPKGYIGHMGGDPGIASYMFFNPTTKTGRIIMINTTVRNSDGVDQFYAIWDTLGEYEMRWASVNSD